MKSSKLTMMASCSSVTVDAASGEAAAKQLQRVAEGTDRIVVCLDGSPMTEMGIDYWQKRMRGRR